MSRTRRVTRTIKTTKVNVLCLNIESAEPFNKTIILSGTFNDNKKLMKEVSNVVDNELEKAVHVIGTEEQETLYGMLEADFIKLAEVLPPRNAENIE